MQEQYVTFDEPLFFLDRLDRFSPLTSKFISYGPRVITPMTQSELVKCILGFEIPDRRVLDRGISARDIGLGVPDVADYLDADSNHSL
jgi:hypothetical protein